jgi:hypothetical protein
MGTELQNTLAHTIFQVVVQLFLYNIILLKIFTENILKICLHSQAKIIPK